MAARVDQVLMKFVVQLVTEDAFHARYDNDRETLMEEKGLSERAKKAIREHNSATVNRLLNQQIVSTFQPKKGAGRKAAPKRAKSAKGAKKPAAKKR